MSNQSPFKSGIDASSIGDRLRELDALNRQLGELLQQGRYDEALVCCQSASKIVPNVPEHYHNAALCLTHLRRWEEAIEYATTALSFGKPILSAYDLLSQAYGWLGKYDEARFWGLKSLNTRAQLFDGPPATPHSPAPLPPAPSRDTREQNIIAFSLFGGMPKYCETAVLNVKARHEIYPDWTCHFYIDETIPEHVVARLDVAGSRVIRISQSEKKWPGPMWRFLAYDTPDLHRVIFRDADSVISQREAKAVAEWIEGGQRFHHMRDFQTHTELLLAGLWGCIAGALPPMHVLIETFMQEPLISEHFADQFFLRKFVWPYARESLMQHDSMFGFLDPLPFPDGPPPGDFHVGVCEGDSIFSFQMEAPEGTLIDWTLFETKPAKRAICAYTTPIRNNRLFLELPAVWAHAYKAGNIEIQYCSRR